MCIFNIFDIRNYIEITLSVIPKPVYLLTVQEAHKEYNSLTDQIQAHVSQLCEKLNLLTPKELYRPTFFKH